MSRSTGYLQQFSISSKVRANVSFSSVIAFPSYRTSLSWYVLPDRSKGRVFPGFFFRYALISPIFRLLITPPIPSPPFSSFCAILSPLCRTVGIFALSFSLSPENPKRHSGSTTAKILLQPIPHFRQRPLNRSPHP